MYREPISKKLIDLMGNQSLSSQERAWALLDCFRSNLSPEDHPEALKNIFECYGLAPRHETLLETPDFEASFIELIERNTQKKVEHALQGWFEINQDQPIERTLVDICMFIEQWSDDKERAVVFQMILASKYIPIAPIHFSKHVDEKNDDYLLREYAGAFIKCRQTLNMNLGPTTRGSLILDFIHEIKGDDQAQAVVLGAFIEELLRRLKQQHQQAPEINIPNPGQAAFPITPDMNPEQLNEMLNNFQSMLPPEILKQLRKLFGGDDHKGFD